MDIVAGKKTNQSAFVQVIEFEVSELFKNWKHVLNAKVWGCLHFISYLGKFKNQVNITKNDAKKWILKRTN